jgi:hypothetical protein
MKIRSVLSVAALALSGLAAKAILRRRRAVADLRKRRQELGRLISEASLTVRNLERELTFASNPPGSAAGSGKPTATLAELAEKRTRAGTISSRSLELQAQIGLLEYLQVKALSARLSTVEAEAAALAEDVEAFKTRVRTARDSGARLS